MKWILACLATLLMPAAALACGPDTDCPLGDRIYRIYEPAEIKHPGAIIFAHGYRGKAAGIMRSKGFRAMADRLGVRLVAAQSYAQDWRIPGVPADPGTDGQLEYSYFANLKTQLETAHGIDSSKSLFTGFSAGGMMVWQLACTQGDTFAAYAPISGTFWTPMPPNCEHAPVNMIHTHGLSDRTVPLAGRPIGSRAHQGDVLEALAMLQRDVGYAALKPSRGTDELTCQSATTPKGDVLEFCTHPGGHSLKSAYVERAWNKLVQMGKL